LIEPSRPWNHNHAGQNRKKEKEDKKENEEEVGREKRRTNRREQGDIKEKVEKGSRV
jgi:hypothetical protein